VTLFNNIASIENQQKYLFNLKLLLLMQLIKHDHLTKSNKNSINKIELLNKTDFIGYDAKQQELLFFNITASIENQQKYLFKF
jgi:hypothetical protein